MIVIDTAFNEAISKTVPKPRKGWWGCFNDNTYYIMRYQHTMVAFNKSEHQIHTCETRTDKAGINAAVELITSWQNSLKKPKFDLNDAINTMVGNKKI